MRLIKIRLFILMLTVGTCLAGCQEKENTAVSKTDFAMGTVIHQTIYGKNASKNETDVMTRLREIENQQLSWRVEGSEIAKINEAAGTKKETSVDPLVMDWMKQTLELAADTNGAIDPTVGTVARLWDIGGDHPRVPLPKEIKEALKLVDYKDVHMNEEGIWLEKKEQKLDLGALGKGIGSGEVKKILEADTTVKGAVISVGGSILVYGEKPDGNVWNIGVQNPRGENDGDTMGVIKTNGDKYISSSGDYEKYIMVDGKRYHHIMNPHTGYPSDSGIIATTVVCDSGILSDGLSTACMILGYEKSLPILEKYHAEAIFIDEDKNVIATDGLKEAFTITAKDYTLIDPK